MSLPMPFAFLLLSQSAESLAGGSGWVGAGLLGLILAWLLLVHLPGKDKQLKDLLDSRDRLMSEQLTAERTSCEKRHTENLTELRMEREARDRRHSEAMDEFAKIHDENKETRHGIKSVENGLSLANALVKQALRLELPVISGGQGQEATTPTK